MSGEAGPPGFAARVAQLATTLALGIAGSLLFWWAGLAVPWISGSMVVVAIAALAGVPLFVPRWLREVVFFALGLSIGSALTPETLAGVAHWPASLLIMLLALPVVSLAAAAALIGWRGWERDDALLASVPGALSLILALADATDADVPRIALVQALRVAILVVVVPPIIMLTTTPGIPGAASLAAPLPGLPEVVLMVAAGLAGAACIRLLRMPAPFLLGALIGSALLHGTGIVVSAIPEAVLIPAFVLLGTGVGVRFAGLGWARLRSGVADGLIVFTIGFALSVAAALAATSLLGFSFGQTVLAFSPGGFEVMIVMAFALGLDAAYVGAHHTVRFAALALLAPVIFGRRPRSLLRGPDDGGPSREP